MLIHYKCAISWGNAVFVDPSGPSPVACAVPAAPPSHPRSAIGAYHLGMVDVDANHDDLGDHDWVYLIMCVYI